MHTNDAKIIEAFVAELIFSNRKVSAPSLVAVAVRKHPKSLAIDAAFAFVSVASAIENPMFEANDVNCVLSTDLYRATAAFVADIYALEKLSGPSPNCGQVAHFWQESSEEYFSKSVLHEHR